VTTSTPAQSAPPSIRATRSTVTPGPISEASARILAALGVAGIAIIHILDAADTYQSTRWLFWFYIALIVAAVPVACLLLQWSSSRVWLLAAGLALGPFVGYLLSRSTGLPGDTGDIGNWLETLGMMSLFVEGCVIALAVTRYLAGRPKPVRFAGRPEPVR
jgi:hypothetical protein